MSISKRPKNATTHGVYSSEVVLSWENQQEFNDLHQALREEYYPDGVSEEAAVFEMARLYWIRRRLTIGTQLAFHGQPDTEALAAAGSDGWEGVARYLKKASGDDDSVCDAIRAMAKVHVDAVTTVLRQLTQAIGDESKKSDPALFEQLHSLSNGIDGIGKETVIPLLRIIETYNFDQKLAERAYRPDHMERDLKNLAHIDRQLTKAMDNLVRAKEYKKYYVRPAIEAQSTNVVRLSERPIGDSEKE